MKPQCTTAAQCLKELARVMEQFGIDSAINAANSDYVLYSNLPWGCDAVPAFNTAKDWQFAIAEVEGKPVFPGDTLYDMHGAITSGIWCKINPEGFSWNPPKPKTVMVEMRVSSAAELARYFSDVDLMTADLYDAVTSIEKSLKESD